MILDFSISSLRIPEFLEYLRTVKDLCLENDPQKLKLIEKLDPLVAAIDQMDNVFNKEKGSKITQTLVLLDSLRDKAIMGIKDVVKGYSNHPDPRISEPAAAIYSIHTSYGNIAKLNYPTESTIIINFLNKCNENEKAKEGINTIVGLKDWFEYLEKTNDEFRKNYQDRIEEQSKASDKVVSDIRDDATTTYDNLVRRINSHLDLTPTAPYVNLQNQINSLIEQYSTILRIRQGGSSIEDNIPTEVIINEIEKKFSMEKSDTHQITI